MTLFELNQHTRLLYMLPLLFTELFEAVLNQWIFNVSSNYICGVHEFIVYTIRYDIFTCAQKLNDMAS